MWRNILPPLPMICLTSGPRQPLSLFRGLACCGRAGCIDMQEEGAPPPQPPVAPLGTQNSNGCQASAHYLGDYCYNGTSAVCLSEEQSGSSSRFGPGVGERGQPGLRVGPVGSEPLRLLVQGVGSECGSSVRSTPHPFSGSWSANGALDRPCGCEV